LNEEAFSGLHWSVARHAAKRPLQHDLRKADSSNEWAADIEEDPIDNILTEATPSP
jgi:hypothetical protein